MADYNLNPTWGSPNKTTDSEGVVIPQPGESTSPAPNFSQTYVDPKEPERAPALSSLYMPNFYKGFIDAATFLIDVPTHLLGQGLAWGAEALGLDRFAKGLRRPETLGGIVKQGFGAYPDQLGFNVTPRAPQNEQERFWSDVFYISGGGLSFPAGLAGAFGTFRAPVVRLLQDAGGRGANSAAAQAALAKAYTAKGPNAARALVDAAREYANKFTVGLGATTKRTLFTEQGLAMAAGAGYGAPELFADDDGRIMMDLGTEYGPDGESHEVGEVNVLPTLKILASMGLPVAVQLTPSGVAIAGDKSKLFPLMRSVFNKARVFAGSLVGGFHEKGQRDLASRIFNELASEPSFLQEKFLPAVESGQFKSPWSSTPNVKIVDGEVVPVTGGLRPDTLQAMKQLGVDDPRLAAMDAALRGKGKTLHDRIGEESRRAKKLDETFDLLRARIGGDESDTYRTIENVLKNLDDEALGSLDDAIANTRIVYESLLPVVGKEEASRLAVELLDGARLTSREVRRKLWDKELVGTEFVDTRRFGDWAIDIIKQTDRNLRVTPGMAVFYKLAGRKRLAEELGIGETGKPLKDADLGGVKGEGDELLKAAEVPENGLYDIFGEPGTLYAQPVKIETLQNFRSEIGDLSRAAYKAMNEKLGARYSRIIDYIDDELLAAKNFEGSDLPLFKNLEPANIRNIKINREYTKVAKERFGPNSEIGRILYRGDKPVPEEFLQKLLKPGAPGARVELFRNALNEPQRVIEGPNVTWQRDPAASLTLGDNPNVIEAELLRRFTGTISEGRVSQVKVDRFLRDYGEAVDKIPGLRDKFNDLKALQSAADTMTAKMTVPNREKVLAAFRQGANAEDVLNAKMLLSEKLTDRRLANTASSYLDADVDQAASVFMKMDPKNAEARSNKLAALLAKDETGAAERGFRAALWRALRDGSRKTDRDGNIVPGIDTPKLVKLIEDRRSYLEKFYTKSQMEYLDEIVKGGPLQRTGTTVARAEITPQDVMAGRQGFGTIETVGAASRTGGQWVFGQLGINPLVATGMGRRIGAYTFGKLGEEKILKFVEDALRDPEKAAALIRRYKELDSWQPPSSVKEKAMAVYDDPSATLKTGVTEGKDYLKKAASLVGKYLKGHSREAIERAVRYGLIPAQAESRKLTVEEDWQAGQPFIYEDNRVRWEIENQEDQSNVGPQSSVAPVVQGQRQMASNVPQQKLDFNPIPDSLLARTSGIGGGQLPGQVTTAQRPTGQASSETIRRGQEVFGPLDPIFRPRAFVNEGGIVSVKRKGRQLVG